MKRLKLFLSLRAVLVSLIAIFGVSGAVYGYSNLNIPTVPLSQVTRSGGTTTDSVTVGGLNSTGAVSPTTNNTLDLGTADLEWNELFAEAVSSTSVTSSSMFVGRAYRVGASEMVNESLNVLVQYATTTVTGSATLDFTDMGLRDYTSGNTPIVSLTAEYNNDAVTLLQCNPHTITLTGMVVECVTIGDDLTAIVAADGVARTIHITLTGRTP